MITKSELGLLHGYLSGFISEADFGELQKLLRENAEARAMLRTLSTVETRLSEMGADRAIFGAMGATTAFLFGVNSFFTYTFLPFCSTYVRPAISL